MSPNLSRPVYKPQLRQFFFLKKEGYYFWKLGMECGMKSFMKLFPKSRNQ